MKKLTYLASVMSVTLMETSPADAIKIYNEDTMPIIIEYKIDNGNAEHLASLSNGGERQRVDIRGLLDDLKHDIGDTNRVITLEFTGWSANQPNPHSCLPVISINKTTDIDKVNMAKIKSYNTTCKVELK